jgi:hypothetical protein
LTIKCDKKKGVKPRTKEPDTKSRPKRGPYVKK